MPEPHRELRRRLMVPTNAVLDPGIDLRRSPRNVVPFRPRDLRRSIPEIDWMKHLAGEFWLPWLPWLVLLPEAPCIKGYDSTVPDIMRACAGAFGVSVEALQSAQRRRPLVTYRQAAVAIVCRLTDKSTPEIGRHFGGRDHSTVIHAKRRMASHIAAVGSQLLGSEPYEWAQAMRRRLDP